MSQEQKLHTMQEKMFGRRFVGACLSNVQLKADQNEKMSNWVNNPQNFLVVLGPPGVGKTYICSAMIELAMNKFHSYRVWNERQLLSAVRQTISDDNAIDFHKAMEYFIDDEFIIIDDVGSTGQTEWREEMLMALVDIRYAGRKATVFTSNLSVSDFYRRYEKRICSRIFATNNTILDLDGAIDHRSEGR